MNRPLQHNNRFVTATVSKQSLVQAKEGGAARSSFAYNLNGHDWVDMGTSVKLATTNIGTTKLALGEAMLAESAAIGALHHLVGPSGHPGHIVYILPQVA